MMKKAIALIMALAMTVPLAACGSASSGSGHSDATKETFEPITLRFGNQHPENSIGNEADKCICEKIAEVTEGRVTVDLYSNNALGDYTSVYEESMVGTIDMAHITAVETYDSRMSGSMLPYLGSSYEELRVAYAPDNYLYQTVSETALRQGLRTFGFFCEGFSGTATNMPVTNPNTSNSDKGTIVRVPSLDNFSLAEKQLGFRTSTIAYSDTYTAIQTGTVDGTCAMPPNLVYQNFRDVTEYYYHYMMTQEATQIIMSQKTWEKLLPEDQEAITKVIQDECAASIDIAAADDAKYMELLREEGVEIIEFTDEERAAFAQDCRENVWPKLAKNTSQEFLDGILASIQ